VGSPAEGPQDALSDVPKASLVRGEAEARTLDPQTATPRWQELSPSASESCVGPRSRTLRVRGAGACSHSHGLLHRATKQFAQCIVDRRGENILALWERHGGELDVRCAGSALREVAKSLASAPRASAAQTQGQGSCVSSDSVNSHIDAGFRRLAEHILGAVASGQDPGRGGGLPRVLSGTAWAFAKSCCEDIPLIDALAAEALCHLHEFEPQDISATAWSWAKMLVVNLPLFDSMSVPVLRDISAYPSHDLSSTAWAFSKLLVLDCPLRDAIAVHAVCNISEYDPAGLTNIAWAWA